MTDFSDPSVKSDVHTRAEKGRSLSIQGKVRGREDLFIDGKVKGSIVIDEQTLTVGPHGRIDADIRAKNVIIHGYVKGHIQASDKVSILEAAQVYGDITAADIVVLDGAHFEGNAKIQRSPESPQKEEAPA